jgi:hypothetical protein
MCDQINDFGVFTRFLHDGRLCVPNIAAERDASGRTGSSPAPTRAAEA